jgi:outer membrane protein assembly factor BamB
VGSYDKKVYALNPKNGTQKWAFTTFGEVESSPAIGPDGTIYVGSDEGTLYALNPDGTKKWAFSTWNGYFSSPAIGADGIIYAGSNDGKLYAINGDGTQKWAFTTGGPVRSSPAVSPDGSIYVGSNDRKLYAIAGSSGLAKSFWPMFHHDLQHLGNVRGSRPAQSIQSVMLLLLSGD